MAPSRVGDPILARYRSAAGNERSALFDEIFEAHRGPVLGLCLRLCASSALAEDALQETFLEVYKALPTFRGEALLGTWIYRVAMRTALRLRARNPPPADAPVDLAPAGGDPSAALAARDEMRVIQAALDALPAEQRMVVALFSIDGLTHGEIARILAIPEGTVWSRLHKGRKALAAALK
jgi:RNA polymerase sigma-70 factor (ECF subfamily)